MVRVQGLKPKPNHLRPNFKVWLSILAELNSEFSLGLTKNALNQTKLNFGSTTTTNTGLFIMLTAKLQQLPKCSAYPGPLSVLVLDNTQIHHGDEILELADRFGVRIEYLPPYSPDLNPIEESFWRIKRFTWHNQVSYGETEGDGIIYDMLEVLDVITPKDAEGYFGHAGYF